MPYEMTLPPVGGGAQEGIVVAWFKREGATVRAGEPLLEVQFDKVSSDVVAPVDGRIERILAPRDAVVSEGQTLAVLLLNDEQAGGGAPAPAASAPAGTPAAAPVPVPAGEVRATPIAKRVAKENGIDLTTLAGTGPGGRITEQDVQAALQKRATAAPQREPLTPMRRTIARRMLESLQSTAQLTLTTEADVTALVQARAELKAQSGITYTDLVVKAVAVALVEHPRINVRWAGDTIELLPEINIGVAVALDEGLIVPVVKQADKLSLVSLSGEIKRLGELARSGRLADADLAGGVFTVTNLGMYGIDAFTPILNAPESAILGVGRIREQIARHEQGLRWRQMMTLSLTVDHRVIDGAPGAAFLQRVCQLLAAPDVLRMP